MESGGLLSHGLAEGVLGRSMGQEHLAYSMEEVLQAWNVLFGQMDFSLELEALQLSRLAFRRRKEALLALKGLSLALWHLALSRSFPRDYQTFYEHFWQHLDDESQTEKQRIRVAALRGRADDYIEQLANNGSADFTAVSEYLMQSCASEKSRGATTRLRLVLLIRQRYERIFAQLL